MNVDKIHTKTHTHKLQQPKVHLKFVTIFELSYFCSNLLIDRKVNFRVDFLLEQWMCLDLPPWCHFMTVNEFDLDVSTYERESEAEFNVSYIKK